MNSQYKTAVVYKAFTCLDTDAFGVLLPKNKIYMYSLRAGKSHTAHFVKILNSPREGVYLRNMLNII